MKDKTKKEILKRIKDIESGKAELVGEEEFLKNSPLRKLILQVKENKNKQKRVTIPRDSIIKHNDYVEVKKHE